MNGKFIETEVDLGKNNKHVANITIASTKAVWEVPMFEIHEYWKAENTNSGTGADNLFYQQVS